MEAEKKRKPSSKNIHDGHRDRMRERFLKSGFEAFAPHEKIEYLLMSRGLGDVYKRQPFGA